MKPTETLLLDLRSSDAAVRHNAALELMEIEDPIAILPLLEAIKKPENVNHRGTLVYALSAFDCLEHLELLVDLVLTGDFEVSWSAFGIIQDFEFAPETSQRLLSQLGKYEIDHLPFEHGAEAYQALIDLITNH